MTYTQSMTDEGKELILMSPLFLRKALAWWWWWYWVWCGAYKAIYLYATYKQHIHTHDIFLWVWKKNWFSLFWRKHFHSFLYIFYVFIERTQNKGKKNEWMCEEMENDDKRSRNMYVCKKLPCYRIYMRFSSSWKKKKEEHMMKHEMNFMRRKSQSDANDKLWNERFIYKGKTIFFLCCSCEFIRNFLSLLIGKFFTFSSSFLFFIYFVALL